MIVLCDMDGVLCDLISPWLKALGEEFGVTVFPEDIIVWDLHRCRKLKHLNGEEIHGVLHRPGFFLGLSPIPGAIEGLKSIAEMGHEVIICSSPAGPVSSGEKLEWLASHLPWLPRRSVILAHRKELVRGDVLIDDRPQHLNFWTLQNPGKTAIGLRWPWNDSVPITNAIKMCKSWADIVAWFKTEDANWNATMELGQRLSRSEDI